MRTARHLPLALLGTALLLTACGAQEGGSPESDAGTGEGEGAFPVTVTDATGEVTLEEAPERIVSLSASHTEMLFAIGAGDQVEAVDEYSTYPEEAPTTSLSGFEPNVEAIVEHDPDLVVLARSAEETASQLETVGVPTLVLDAAVDLEDTYGQIRLLGEATGNAEEADAEAERVESEFDAIVENVREQVGDTELSFYQELDETSYAATSDTFVGDVYESFGLVNIADAADADGAAGGYPQLSQEYIVEEDPDLIFLSYGDDSTVTEVTERPAFDTVTAVRNDAVYLLDADIASRWGPRVVEFADLIGQAVIENADK
ncbi:ABC transporter substrate-binding protein [Nocardiopsis sp. TSRI0078]|uniref:helical backbone metal receptor n=1 Tax=unclassified Nocardiopsis TaxID=2649073 RepID=UPI00093C472C|nr:helical backbone metal receptor [Nocardiopsis sp. TSRI0078]OKI14532.1 ABC transporter substrate-binding protein [Nocardiopsis sp. TSRI0078]